MIFVTYVIHAFVSDAINMLFTEKCGEKSENCQCKVQLACQCIYFVATVCSFNLVNVYSMLLFIDMQ